MRKRGIQIIFFWNIGHMKPDTEKGKGDNGKSIER